MDRLVIENSLEYWPPLNSGLTTVDEASRIALDGTVYTKVPNQLGAHGSHGIMIMVKAVGRDSVTLCAKELILRDDSASFSIVKHQNEKIRKEFESYKRFAHPHLAAAIDIAYMQDGSALPWLILEHIPFGLADYLTRHPHERPWPEGPLPTLDPVDIILQLFSFAAFLHQQGTPGFAAPEILSKQPQDEKVDIFSLGMIAFYLLTGLYPERPKKPFSPQSQVQFMCESVLPYFGKVEDRFTTLLGGLLAYDAKDRWSAQQVIKYFWRLSNGSNPDYHRKRTASPMVFPENKKRRMSEDASTIRGPPAASEYPPSSTSFETAQDLTQQLQADWGVDWFQGGQKGHAMLMIFISLEQRAKTRALMAGHHLQHSVRNVP
ncbi:hypothetical protein INS49_003949 [Diaporthe citri]|uniref:uncharacterized protein n=1 Tax=Diaporthe citri TaxID=83186 RepID=UPI001C808698|nr:uncharacterized protein INS49_003949 [Diaporthe citri]KAG6354868.1 hypothetical protein INS49_003949 [Diaporthe citri]